MIDSLVGFWASFMTEEVLFFILSLLLYHFVTKYMNAREGDIKKTIHFTALVPCMNLVRCCLVGFALLYSTLSSLSWSWIISRESLGFLILRIDMWERDYKKMKVDVQVQVVGSLNAFSQLPVGLSLRRDPSVGTPQSDACCYKLPLPRPFFSSAPL